MSTDNPSHESLFDDRHDPAPPRGEFDQIGKIREPFFQLDEEKLKKVVAACDSFFAAVIEVPHPK